MSETTQWVTQLLERHARVATGQTAPAPDALKALNSLQLADAIVDKGQLNSAYPDHALQVAIIGPTQSGKSTLVNLLLDSQAATISALAGFTVHAQGYASGYEEDQLQLLTTMMEPLQRVPAAELNAADLETYVLEPAVPGPQALLNPAVVWDTPDFDSIDAGTYKRAVMNTVAIADIVVLMVSKDKYGDKSVWDILQLIHPLQQPLLVCINKLDPQDEQAVLQAFSSRYQQQFETPVPPVILLPFVRRNSPGQRVSMPHETRQALGAALAAARAQVNRGAAIQTGQAFITQHRDQWLAPLVQEQSAASSWSDLVTSAMSRAEDQYARDYLNNPDKYETFNRALAELLTLLEVPGLAAVFTRTRQLVTWPARKLLGVGRDALGSRFEGARSKTPVDQDAETLERVLDSTLVSLQGSLLDQPQQQAFWAAMTQAFRKREPDIRQSFLTQSERVRKEFEPQIDEAARRLYEQLQAQPALLNTLRAARVTADAAGIALALKSGGIAPADLVLAPAMLSVTTLLTESALGKYLDTIKAELKERQRQHINDRLLQGLLATELRQLSATLPEDALFAQGLEPELHSELLKQLTGKGSRR
ncbi:GTPase [Granulosicoccus antarcticus]|uniref:GTPase Der n=1 Tax=Granulosicoccus antarcticus IMCC3135 TaxID=1192854 RepID=A0A2Z2NYP4_9GAMM|nr:GTPase domain-containing protein [Granulosicoccus antarcticus]ASJ76562.1 GTPase Der [Granulosicoccus antarcticus IMCC3135]